MNYQMQFNNRVEQTSQGTLVGQLAFQYGYLLAKLVCGF